MRIKHVVVLACLLLACAPQLPRAQENNNRPRIGPIRILRSDLIVKEYQFAPTNNKGLRVNVANIGNGNAGACILRLTVRRINGVAVGRTMDMSVPAIPAGGDDWITFIADGILPKDVDIKDTTFRLNVDFKNVVKESNENNNEKWHNLN